MDEIKLGRIGHYHIPGQDGSDGSCQTAIITKVWSPFVNVSAFEHGGDEIQGHVSVKVVGAGEELPVGASFHLNRACPFER